MNIFLLASFGFSQEMNVPMQKIRSNAEDALGTLRKLVNEKNMMSMGFRSMDEVKQAQLGSPLVKYYVGLNDLKEYKEGTDISKMLHFGDQVLFPVTVNDMARSSIQMEKQGEDWKATAYGSPNLIQILERTINILVQDTSVKSKDFMILSIPAMNQVYLAYWQDKELWMAPAISDERYEFKMGVPMMASAVFEKLLPDAQKLEDLPR
jgi:hypothetical protein